MPLPPITSPFFYDTGGDYQDNHLTITIPFDEVTRLIQDGGVIHRDPGCVYSVIVWDNPSDPQKAKRLAGVPDGDTVVTARQIKQATGFTTAEDLVSVQITAEPGGGK
ncbi:hypothetical protein [Terrabacter terrigena]|uniref:Uncharacterized protein n=1 Tax=Terrabacter terrigena TaxID=574718 RepID=A0ABW3N164_9MICO